MSPLPSVITIAFETSAPDAPHERAWPSAIGATVVGTGVTREWLVKPEEEWLLFRGWDEAALRDPGRDLGDLLAKGKPAAEVAAEVDAWLTDTTVLAADPAAAADWMGLLMATANLSAPAVSPALRYMIALTEGGEGDVATAMAQAAYRVTADGAGAEAEQLAHAIRILSGPAPVRR
ncbi:hypothetical protein [Azospirillum argentinense]|uniref:hypothetical protein n=1 Tax=Azospirillum argentinense TaxID=2970906 RepID=UPI0032DF0901